MATRLWLSLSLAALMAVSAPAQNAQSVLQAAAKAMGIENMRSIMYSGAGWQGMVGQNFLPDRDWPRVDLQNYTRTIDFDTMSSREGPPGRRGTTRRRAAAPASRSWRRSRSPTSSAATWRGR